jgi:hypothetical protein
MGLLYKNGKAKVVSNPETMGISNNTKRLREEALKKAAKNSNSKHMPIYKDGSYLPESANKPVMYKNILQPKTNSYKVTKFKKGSKTMC